MHKSRNYHILEIEGIAENVQTLKYQNFYHKLIELSVYMQKLHEPEELYDYIVKEIRSLTGFDRVKLDCFDELSNGTVIAESKQAHMPSYMGLSFPHSDIPSGYRIIWSYFFYSFIQYKAK